MDSIDTFDNLTNNEGNRKGDETMGQSAVKWQSGVNQNWVTTGEAKKLLGVSSVNTVKRWIAEGKLIGYQAGENNWMRVSVESIYLLLESGDENVQAFRRLKQQLDTLSDLDYELTEEDLNELSDRRTGNLPWERKTDQ